MTGLRRGQVLGLRWHPMIVSERLGHATVTITLDLYSHARESMQTEAARMVADIVCDEIGRRS